MKRWTVFLLLLAGPVGAQEFLCATHDVSRPITGVPRHQRVGSPASAVTISVVPVLSQAAFRRNPNADKVAAVIQKASGFFEASGTGITLHHGVTMAMNRATNRVAERLEHSSLSTWETAASDLLETMRTSPELETARSSYEADLVVAFTDGIPDAPPAGYAYVPSNNLERQYGFSIIATDYPEYAAVLLAHEIGHNLGLAHESGARGRSPYLSYGRGYQDGENQTIMSTRDGLFTAPRFSRDGFYTVKRTDGTVSRQIRIGDRYTRAADAAMEVAEIVASYEGPRPRPEPEPEPEPPPQPPTSTSVYLHGRFDVSLSYESDGRMREAKVVDVDLPGDSSALFYFFSPDNSEVLFKVLDGCGVNGHWWVYYAAATDQYLSIDIYDRQGGGRWSKRGMDRTASDTQAFSCR